MTSEHAEEGNSSQLDELATNLVSQARERTAGMRTVPALPKQKKVSLMVTGGPLKGKTFPVDKPQVLIGRAQADVTIEDSQVSRKHCVLEVHDLNALLVD